MVEEYKANLYKLVMPEPIEDLPQKIKNFILENPEIDGIFAVNDFMALKVMKVMKSLGKEAPQDYQIIGYDGVKNAIDQDYFLSTIKQPTDLMAKTAVETLISIINGEEPVPRIILPVSFQDAGTTR